MNYNNKYKLQFLLENILVLLILLTILILFFSLNRNILAITLVITMFLLITIFEILKKKGKWFESKSTFSKLFSISQVIIVSILLNMSHNDVIPRFVGVIYPILILVYIMIKDYKFNFK